MSKSFITIICGLLLLVACKEQAFQHQLTSEKHPWKHINFDNQQDKFTFAIFSDLTGGEREGVFEQAVAQLNLLRPELIVNVGDLLKEILKIQRNGTASGIRLINERLKQRLPFFTWVEILT